MTENHDLWKVNNKVWLKARQTRWSKKVLPQLKEMTRYWTTFLHARDLPFLKAYFLKGDLLTYDEKWFEKLDYATQLESHSRAMIGTPYQIPLLFKVWFYPEGDPNLFKSWCQQASNQEIRRYDKTARNSSSQGHKGCEFFAGRSYYLDRYLVPKTFDEYVASIYDLSPRSEDKQKEILRLNPSRKLALLRDIIDQKLHCLAGNGRFSYVFCHELFIDLIQSTDIQEVAPRGNRTYEGMIKATMNLILHKNNKDFDPKHPMIEKLKSEMIEQFEAGITPEIDTLWQESQKGPFKLN